MSRRHVCPSRTSPIRWGGGEMMICCKVCIDVDVDVDVGVGVDVDVDDDVDVDEDSLPQVEEPDFSILRQRHYRARFL